MSLEYIPTAEDLEDWFDYLRDLQMEEVSQETTGSLSGLYIEDLQYENSNKTEEEFTCSGYIKE